MLHGYTEQVSTLHTSLDLGTFAKLVQAKDTSGRTALFHAVSSGNLDVVRMLLSASAAVDARDVKGETPLHVAIRRHIAQRDEGRSGQGDSRADTVRVDHLQTVIMLLDKVRCFTYCFF